MYSRGQSRYNELFGEVALVLWSEGGADGGSSWLRLHHIHEKVICDESLLRRKTALVEIFLVFCVFVFFLILLTLLHSR